MCARYITFNHRDDDIFFGIAPFGRRITEANEIHPKDEAPVFVRNEDIICIQNMQWGLPMQRSGVIFNARAETIDEKKLFKDSYLLRRCVVPAYGFFEWDKVSGRQYVFHVQEDSIVYMAGIYQLNFNIPRFVIITTQSSDPVSSIHPRMPLLFNAKQAMDWLESSEQAQKLRFMRCENLIREEYPA